MSQAGAKTLEAWIEAIIVGMILLEIASPLQSTLVLEVAANV